MTAPADFPWRPGMLVRCSPSRDWLVTAIEGTIACLIEADSVWPKTWGYRDTDGADLSDGWEPVLTDGATLGALAGAVREAWGDPYAHAVPLVEGSLVGPPRWRWRVLCAVPGPEPIRVRLRDFIDDDLGTAWLAAWAARPRSTP